MDSRSCNSYRNSMEYVEESHLLDSSQPAWWTTNPEGRECLPLNRPTMAQTVPTVTMAPRPKYTYLNEMQTSGMKTEPFQGDDAKENRQFQFQSG